jgi:hypothetical protein
METAIKTAIETVSYCHVEDRQQHDLRNYGINTYIG